MLNEHFSRRTNRQRQLHEQLRYCNQQRSAANVQLLEHSHLDCDGRHLPNAHLHTVGHRAGRATANDYLSAEMSMSTPMRDNAMRLALPLVLPVIQTTVLAQW